MIYLFSFLVVFTAAVLVHELGHFLAARALGMKVYEFSIGFPVSPRVIRFFKHRETEFTLRLLPLGGFVAFSKDGDPDGSSEFLAAQRWKRAIVVSAGPAFNAVFNLLPVPALDGGQLVTIGIEAVRRKALGPAFYRFAGTAGIAVFVILTLTASWRDVSRIPV